MTPPPVSLELVASFVCSLSFPGRYIYTDAITACKTPVPAPPTKRRKVSCTSLPYNFSNHTLDEILTGLQRLFHSHQVCNSCNPADVFKVKLFGESGEVSFASPLDCISQEIQPAQQCTGSALMHEVRELEGGKERQERGRKARRDKREREGRSEGGRDGETREGGGYISVPPIKMFTREGSFIFNPKH